MLALGLIAQWIEHPPSKRVVVGSNPTQSMLFLVFLGLPINIIAGRLSGSPFAIQVEKR